jgi:hypothetical protein
MFDITSNFLTEIKKSTRTVNARIGIGDILYDINGSLLYDINDEQLYSTENPEVFMDTDTIVGFDIESSFGSNNIPTLGGVISNKLILEFVNTVDIPSILVGEPLVVFVGIDVNGIFEWVQMGTFYPSYGDVVKGKLTTKLEAYDVMIDYDSYRYDSALAFPATIQDMISEITTDYGIVFEIQTLPSVSFPTKPIGTVRQVIGMIASLCTTNATINCYGEVSFKFLTYSGFGFDADNYIDFKLTSDTIVRLSQLSITTDDEEVDIIAGDGTGFALEFENSAITNSSELQTVLNREFPLEFYAYKLTAQGMPHLQVGDTIEFTDSLNVIRTLAIVNHKFSYNGGMKSIFTVDCPSSTNTTITITGGSTLTKAISQSYADLNVAIANATNLITGADGGYLKTLYDNISGLPSGLAISDNEDLDLASKVWVWNENGFGFSSTGYSGTYGLAMTMDGQIVADFITTGTLNAALLNVENLVVGDNVTMGTNAYISWDNVTSQPSIPTQYTDLMALDTINATYIDVNGIWTPSVYAENISTLNASISTAQIETLTVGTNVIMGANAYISWDNVTSQPTIPVLPSYIQSTYIDSTTIYSPTISGGTITGTTIRTSNTADYFSVKDQYVDFYADNIKNIRIGIDETWAYDKYPFISFGPYAGDVLTMKNYIWYAQGSVGGQDGGKLTMKGSETLTLISNGTTTVNASQEIYINAPSVNINGGDIINLPNGCFLECLTNRLILHANAGSYLDIRDTGTWLYASSGTSKQL